MKRRAIIMHLSPTAIKQQFLSCRDAKQKKRWRALWLMVRPVRPLSADQCAVAVGFTGGWVRALVVRWNEHGTAALNDGRRRNGRKNTLTAENRFDLRAALRKPPKSGRPRTPSDVQAFVSKAFSKNIGRTTAWKWLRSVRGT